MAGRKHWTRPRMAVALNELGSRLGRAPSARDLQTGDETLPSYQTLRREYGSLEAALAEANMARTRR